MHKKHNGNLLNRKDAAAFLGTTVHTMSTWSNGNGFPPFIKIGNGCFYDKKDLNEFLERRRNKTGSADVNIPQQEGRDNKGRFSPGNKIAEYNLAGVRSIEVRRHREFFNQHVPDIMKMLVNEAIEHKNTEVGRWIIDKIIPNSKSITFADSASVIKSLQTLTDVKNSSETVIKEASEGVIALEEMESMMDAFEKQSKAIERADIEPLANAVREKMGKRN